MRGNNLEATKTLSAS